MVKPQIGQLHRTPLLPVCRSLDSGYVGRLSNWTGTPRQLERLAEAAETPPFDARRWFRDAMFAAAGATAVLAWLTR